jgi:hypothetical protein
MKRLAYGVANNDAGYVVQDYKDGRRISICPYYEKWIDIIKRCKGELSKTTTPTYRDVGLHQEWLTFSNFKSWMSNQDWQGKDIDKDIMSVLTGKKEYSPDNCVFVTHDLNGFFVNTNKKTTLPVGVSVASGGKKFSARCRTGDSRKYLGRFSTTEEAHKAWQLAKWKYGQELLQEQTDPRVSQAMHVILHKLGEDWSLGRITEKLV